ncbi:MAG TPA: helix-turn-helix domain-containing protein [Pseudonocardiaceae bacterium]|nr:helix-turn-helix domain-containing protein [Pseudonocardiaceae bacterium]
MAQRPNELTPHASPRHFWGAELRARRTAKGLSLDALGKLVYRDRSYLAKIEKGERSIPEDLARACDQAVGADGTLIRLHALIMSPDGRDVVAPSPAGRDVAKSALHVAKPSSSLADELPQQAPSDMGDEVSIPARTPDGRVIFVNVSRRFFMRGVAATAVGAMITGQPTMSSATALQAAGATRAPDLNPVEHLQQMRNLLIDSDKIFGPAQVLPTVTQHIELIHTLRRGQRSADQRALLNVHASFAEFAAWLHQDLGDYASAEHWLNRALEWSHGTHDADLTTFILARGAQLAGDLGDPDRVLDLAYAAESMARPGSRLAVIAGTYAGHGHALHRDAHSTHQAYDHARELLADVQDDPDSPWGPWMDSAYIGVQESRSLAAVGEYEAAAQGFQAAIEALPTDYRRERGLHLARAARAYAGIGEVEQSSALGMESLVIGLETRSGRILTELASLDQDLTSWNTPAVAEFRNAMAQSISRQV